MAGKPPRVSVVIPNYNYARYVSQAIDSALAQTYRDFEIVVIDNGSTDNSLEVLRGYGDRIRVISQENRGQTGSRNRAVAEARGELLAFLDADDLWLATKLEKQVPFFADARVGIVYCGHSRIDGEGKLLSTTEAHKRGNLLKDFAVGAGAVILCGESTAVIRKECFDKVGLFDANLSISAGWDMYRRICSLYEVEVVPEALMLYRQHGSNAHGRIDIFERDLLYRLEKMYADPLSAAIHKYKRQSYALTYKMLAGSYYHAGNVKKAVEYGAKALATWPPALVRRG